MECREGGLPESADIHTTSPDTIPESLGAPRNAVFSAFGLRDGYSRASVTPHRVNSWDRPREGETSGSKPYKPDFRRLASSP